MDTLNSEYELLSKQLAALLEGEDNAITNLSQFAAVIFNNLSEVNWAGFYLVNEKSMLKLGPFQGQTACTNIEFGKGVCGTSAATREAQLVDDVDQFPGHIACDSRSRSEIVCPLIVMDELIGVFDVDSPVINRFNSQDLLGIRAMLKILVKTTNWVNLLPLSNDIG